MFDKIKQFYNQFLNKLLQQFVGYYDGQLHRFDIANDEITISLADEKFKPVVVVASRSFYKESQQQFPIANRKELQNLLALQQQTGDKFSVVKVADEHSYVNKWQFNQTIPQAMAVLPETLLLSSVVSSNTPFVYQYALSKTVYAGKNDQGVFSVVSSPMINHIDKFTLSTGLGQVEEYTLSKPSVLSLLLQGIRQLPLKQWLPFVELKQNIDKKRLLLQTLLPSLLVFFVYLAASSSYLVWQKEQYISANQALSATVNSLVDSQNQLGQDIGRIASFNAFLQDKQSEAAIWVVAKNALQQAQINNIRKERDGYLIRGITKNKASDILQVMIDSPYVKKASFIAPTRTSRKKEYFTIRVELKKHVTIAGAAS